MVCNISKFVVTGLNGTSTISVPIKKNKLILVGRNGLGKSTFLNILYFLLSKQWARMLEIDFKSVRIETSAGKITLDRSDLQEEMRWREESSGRFPMRYNRFLSELHDEGHISLFLQTDDESKLLDFASRLAIPISSLKRFREDVRRTHLAETATRIVKVSALIDLVIGDRQILYLPTYRRIEKDLRIVIPELEDYIKRYNDSPSRAKPSPRKGDSYVELVEFGMEDVEKKFELTLSRLKDNARQVFNALAGSYLRDFIRGEGRSFERSEIASLKPDDIKSILNRVEENTLSDPDKNLLQSAITRIAVNRSDLQSDDSFIAHIFSKLITTSRQLEEREEPVTGFVKACNKYLEGKKIVYDEISYKIEVRNETNMVVQLQFLSSGEKQIISLFSQLYLSGNQKYLIIIDEPELSLSMPWQYTFLPDIVSSGHCDFIAAVTHSPFISDNNLDAFTIDMQECVKQS